MLINCLLSCEKAIKISVADLFQYMEDAFGFELTSLIASSFLSALKMAGLSVLLCLDSIMTFMTKWQIEIYICM